mgnify:CR=1 FL=1
MLDPIKAKNIIKPLVDDVGKIVDSKLIQVVKKEAQDLCSSAASMASKAYGQSKLVKSSISDASVSINKQISKKVTGVPADILQKRKIAFDKFLEKIPSDELDEVMESILQVAGQNQFFKNKEQLVKNFPWEVLSDAIPRPHNYIELSTILKDFLPTADSSIYSGLNDLYKNSIVSRIKTPLSKLIKNWSPQANNFPFAEIKDTRAFGKIRSDADYMTSLY